MGEWKWHWPWERRRSDTSRIPSVALRSPSNASKGPIPSPTAREDAEAHLREMHWQEPEGWSDVRLINTHREDHHDAMCLQFPLPVPHVHDGMGVEDRFDTSR